MPGGITLRPLTENDGPAFAGLSISSADGGMIQYAANYQTDAFKAVQALHGDMEGVVASTGDGWRIVGAAIVRYGRCQFEGECYPFALLGNLIVHPDYRGQGLAAQLVDWQIAKARERGGDELVLATNFQAGNKISNRIFVRMLPRSAGTMTYQPMQMLHHAPPGLPGITTGPLDPAENSEFAECHNNFYANWNFAQTITAGDLEKLVKQSPFTTPIRHPYVAVDRSGSLLAGLMVLEEYRLKTMEIRGLPRPLHLLNNIMHIIPEDGAVRELYLDHLWFRPGQAQALRHLVDAVRWIWSNRATNLSVLIDPRSPLRKVFPIRPWSVTAKTQLLFEAPSEITSGRPVCPIY